MNQIQSDTIKANLDYDEQNVKELQAHFNQLIDVERKRYYVLQDFAKTLQKMAQDREKIKSIADIYDCINKGIIKYINKVRIDDPSDDGFLKMLEKRMIPSLNGHLGQIQVVRGLLQKYIQKNNLQFDWEEKFNIAKTKNDDKLSKIEKSYDEAKKEKQQSSIQLQQNYATYLFDRNSEMKAMFKHLMNGFLDICACGMTEFAAAAKKIHKTDELKETDTYIGKMLGNQNLKS